MHKFVKRWLAIVVCGMTCWALPSVLFAEESKTTDQGQWIELFDGKTLTGWTPKFRGYEAGVNYNDTFRAVDGVIRVAYDKYDQGFDNRFGHLFYEREFSDYILRLEYRFLGEQCPGGEDWALRNSGVMLHGQSLASMRKDQEFPVSLEAQFLGGDGQNARTTGNLCTPGTHVVLDGKLCTEHCVNSTSPSIHGDEWVSAELEVHGSGVIRHKINGQTVMEYGQAQLDPTDADAKRLLDAGSPKLITQGTISLQAESHPIEFRNIRLLPLNPSP